MKVSQFKKLEEGFFSDLGNIGSSSNRDNQDKISEKSKKLFIKDFIKDFNADAKKYMDAGLIKTRVKMNATSSTVTEEYEYFNDLVEGYLAEQKLMTPVEFVKSWFDAYMKGVDWQSEEANVEAIAKEIEQSYKTDKGLAGITKLADLAWKLVSGSDRVPHGAQEILPRGVGNISNLDDTDKKLLGNVLGSMDNHTFKRDLAALLNKHKR